MVCLFVCLFVMFVSYCLIYLFVLCLLFISWFIMYYFRFASFVELCRAGRGIWGLGKSTPRRPSICCRERGEWNSPHRRVRTERVLFHEKSSYRESTIPQKSSYRKSSLPRAWTMKQSAQKEYYSTATPSIRRCTIEWERPWPRKGIAWSAKWTRRWKPWVDEWYCFTRARGIAHCS